jgi:hypothetical protein
VWTHRVDPSWKASERNLCEWGRLGSRLRASYAATAGESSQIISLSKILNTPRLRACRRLGGSTGARVRERRWMQCDSCLTTGLLVN